MADARGSCPYSGKIRVKKGPGIDPNGVRSTEITRGEGRGRGGDEGRGRGEEIREHRDREGVGTQRGERGKGQGKEEDQRGEGRGTDYKEAKQKQLLPRTRLATSASWI